MRGKREEGTSFQCSLPLEWEPAAGRSRAGTTQTTGSVSGAT